MRPHKEHYIGNGHCVVAFEDGSAFIYDDYGECVTLTAESVNKLIEIWQEARKEKE